MKKSFSIIITCLLCVLITAAISLAVEKGPSEIVLRSTIDPAKKAKLAFFPHADHQGNFECAICHHSKGDDGKQVAYTDGMAVAKCESCHNNAAEIPDKLNTFKKAAHERCKGCHKTLKKEGKKAGPTKCNGCHRKDLK